MALLIMVLRREIRVLVWRIKLVFVNGLVEPPTARNNVRCNFLHSVCKALVVEERITVLVDGLDWGTILSMESRKIRSRSEAMESSSALVWGEAWCSRIRGSRRSINPLRASELVR